MGAVEALGLLLVGQAREHDCDVDVGGCCDGFVAQRCGIRSLGGGVALGVGDGDPELACTGAQLIKGDVGPGGVDVRRAAALEAGLGGHRTDHCESLPTDQRQRPVFVAQQDDALGSRLAGDDVDLAAGFVGKVSQGQETSH